MPLELVEEREERLTQIAEEINQLERQLEETEEPEGLQEIIDTLQGFDDSLEQFEDFDSVEELDWDDEVEDLYDEDFVQAFEDQATADQQWLDYSTRVIQEEDVDEEGEPQEYMSEGAIRSTISRIQRSIDNGQRHTMQGMAQADPGSGAWIRVSSTGSPCAFCAMLISRGPVYKSVQKAVLNGNAYNMEAYHDQCKCRCIFVPYGIDWRRDPRFALNKFYRDLWYDGYRERRQSTSSMSAAWARQVRGAQRAPEEQPARRAA